MPLQTLDNNLNKEITLITRKGSKYIGKLNQYDEHGNILLINTAIQTDQSTEFLGDVIINNANVIIIDINN
ncbi:hypothetical protein H312_00504 [Anncaliia algerae PRA339]|uniref:Sm domain-containing protein n=1 Tax=Anncaliia algerae PRA339 TaxID=1288291 RepID=A0A059F4K3_9MICR|nr:hypothetical protein H312_00504 [Anncaliia algerae PRA339]